MAMIGQARLETEKRGRGIGWRTRIVLWSHFRPPLLQLLLEALEGILHLRLTQRDVDARVVHRELEGDVFGDTRQFGPVDKQLVRRQGARRGPQDLQAFFHVRLPSHHQSAAEGHGNTRNQPREKGKQRDISPEDE